MEAEHTQQEPPISKSTSATAVTYFGSHEERNQRENNQAFADVYEVMQCVSYSFRAVVIMLNCINLKQQPAVVYENICGQSHINYTLYYTAWIQNMLHFIPQHVTLMSFLLRGERGRRGLMWRQKKSNKSSPALSLPVQLQ